MTVSYYRKPRLFYPFFFLPSRCGHCQALKDDWEAAARALKGIVTVAAVDADAHPSLAQEFDVQGFPTIKAMVATKSGQIISVNYNGPRSAKDIVAWAIDQAQKVALKRLGSNKASHDSRQTNSDSDGFYAGTNVFELTDANFHSKVTDSGDAFWFVEFYAPWCGHCKALKPTWIELAGELDSRVMVGAVDCTANQQTCSEFGVKGFPTVILFGSDKSKPATYNGARDLGSLSSFAIEKWARAQPPPEVRELTDDVVWTEHCIGHAGNSDLGLKEKRAAQLCLIAFVPNILDTKAVGRRELLDALQKVAEEHKERQFAWFWAEGGTQPDLEANFGVGGYGYPGFVALSPQKGKYASMRSAFSLESLKEFITDVRTGKERVAEINGKLAAIVEAAPWDGKDGEEILEEEISLEDLGIELPNQDSNVKEEL